MALERRGNRHNCRITRDFLRKEFHIPCDALSRNNLQELSRPNATASFVARSNPSDEVLCGIVRAEVFRECGYGSE